MSEFRAERPRKYRSDQPAYRGWRTSSGDYFVRAFEVSSEKYGRRWCAVAALDTSEYEDNGAVMIRQSFVVVIRVTPCRDEAHAIETAREFLARAVAEQLTADANEGLYVADEHGRLRRTDVDTAEEKS